jgi:hypothetical protein
MPRTTKTLISFTYRVNKPRLDKIEKITEYAKRVGHQMDFLDAGQRSRVMDFVLELAIKFVGGTDNLLKQRDEINKQLEAREVNPPK